MFNIFELLTALKTKVALAASNCTYNNYSSASEQLCNPLKQNNITGLIAHLVQIAMGLIGVVAVLMIVIAGFRMVLSRGNESAVKNAQETIKWAVIGLVIAVLSYSIITILENLITK